MDGVFRIADLLNRTPSGGGKTYFDFGETEERCFWGKSYPDLQEREGEGFIVGSLKALLYLIRRGR